MLSIRNFCIVAHVDHGKSTLADRLLEITQTVPSRKMQNQYLDKMELERERGITIKMAPVRMIYKLNRSEISKPKSQILSEFMLNLIDTPGHSDFSYEVSRALQAVEGAILLVDATQGIQAQTLANLRAVLDHNLAITPAISKVDLNPDGMESLRREVGALVSLPPEAVHMVSGKTGEGVRVLLEEVIRRTPPPVASRDAAGISRALIFDSFYDNHKGVVASVRIFDGEFKKDQVIRMVAAGTNCRIKELGTFAPELLPSDSLGLGEIGYLATGIKNPEQVRIGDTILGEEGDYYGRHGKTFALAGYKEPKPVVFVSFYPEEASEHRALYSALQKLRLSDAALAIEPDKNEVLGRGFRVGFLGQLHFEITAERLKREFNMGITHTFPSVAYRVETAAGWVLITNPMELPENHGVIQEPMVRLQVIMPSEQVNDFFRFQTQVRCFDVKTETLGERAVVTARMPLAELVSDFDDRLKSATSGYGSFTYELDGFETADVVRVDMLVAGEMAPGLSRFFHRSAVEGEGRKMARRLKDLLPRQQFAQAVQAAVGGKIIAREDIPALRKNVTGHLYGGDRTRKMKLWQKQKKGKKRLKERATVRISANVFKELLKH